MTAPNRRHPLRPVLFMAAEPKDNVEPVPARFVDQPQLAVELEERGGVAPIQLQCSRDLESNTPLIFDSERARRPSVRERLFGRPTRPGVLGPWLLCDSCVRLLEATVLTDDLAPVVKERRSATSALLYERLDARRRAVVGGTGRKLGGQPSPRILSLSSEHRGPIHPGCFKLSGPDVIAE